MLWYVFSSYEEIVVRVSYIGQQCVTATLLGGTWWDHSPYFS